MKSSLFALFLFFPVTTLHAQQDSASVAHASPFTLVLNDVSTSADDGLHFFSFQAYEGDEEWIYLGGSVGLTTLAMTLDEGMRKMMLRNKGSFAEGIATPGNEVGSVGSITLSGALYLGGLFAGDEWTRVTGRQCIEALAFAGIITQVLKFSLGRSRPYRNDGAFSFHGFSLDDSRMSLPSGHTMVAFSVASVLASRIDNIFASVAIYALAGTTWYHRLYYDRHWLSDVLLSSAIGYGAGKAVVHMGERSSDQSHSSASTSWLLYPMISPNGAGVSLLVRL